MSNRNPRGNRAARRQQAKMIANGDVDILASVPRPPDPTWQHWWDTRSRSWMRHDPRVIEWVGLLSATGGQTEDVIEIVALILDARARVDGDVDDQPEPG